MMSRAAAVPPVSEISVIALLLARCRLTSVSAARTLIVPGGKPLSRAHSAIRRAINADSGAVLTMTGHPARSAGTTLVPIVAIGPL